MLLSQRWLNNKNWQQYRSKAYKSSMEVIIKNKKARTKFGKCQFSIYSNNS